MTTSTPRSVKPGKITPKKIAVGGMSTTTTIKFFATKIIAIRAILARAISGFYLYRGIGLDAIALLMMTAVYVIRGML